MSESGRERIYRITAALEESELDVLICTLPANVLLLSGYWPVVGTAVAAVTRDGSCVILAPEDEEDLAMAGWADEIKTYRAGSLESLAGPEQAVIAPLGELLRALGCERGRVGYEDGNQYEGSTYAALHLFGASLPGVLQAAAPDSVLLPAAAVIALLRSSLTPEEVDKVRVGCELAGVIFTSVSWRLRPGMREPEVAVGFAAPIEVLGLAHPGVRRAGAYVWCMSGPNSALAGAAYARTRDRELQEGDLVLVHCNSYIDGYWTDITRTFSLGEPDAEKRALYDAVFAAREAALSAIRPGARAAGVDAAARGVLVDHVFGEFFTHGTGHNVGFSAIGDEFPPRLHPASPDRLEVGMTCNIEPAIYLKGFGGVRHSDVVTVRDDGPEVLTPFQAGIEDLWIPIS